MCGPGPASVSYVHNMKTQKIPKKNYDHLIRWTHGALVRRQILKQIALAKLAGKFHREALLATQI